MSCRSVLQVGMVHHPFIPFVTFVLVPYTFVNTAPPGHTPARSTSGFAVARGGLAVAQGSQKGCVGPALWELARAQEIDLTHRGA